MRGRIRPTTAGPTFSVRYTGVPTTVAVSHFLFLECRLSALTKRRNNIASDAAHHPRLSIASTVSAVDGAIGTSIQVNGDKCGDATCWRATTFCETTESGTCGTLIDIDDMAVGINKEVVIAINQYHRLAV